MFKQRFLVFLWGLLMSGLLIAQVPDLPGRIVFVSDKGGAPNLWIYDFSTGELEQISNFPGDDYGIIDVYYPRWSPDGQKILFGGWTSNVYSSEIYGFF